MSWCLPVFGSNPHTAKVNDTHFQAQRNEHKMHKDILNVLFFFNGASDVQLLKDISLKGSCTWYGGL